MNFLDTLFEGAEGVWSGGIAHILIIVSTVVALGKLLGNTKLFGVSFGVTWVLFVGIIFGHFGLTIDRNLLHFLKEFGLVLFVYSVGFQVGPGFFSCFRSGGLGHNALAVSVILMGVGVALLIFWLTGTPITTMVGVMSGAVTNTPGLGAAQQAFSDMSGQSASDIALGYAVAYPMGVIGCILSFIVIRKILYRKNLDIKGDARNQDETENESTPLLDTRNDLISRKILISKPKINGMTLAELQFPENLGATIVRINRSGIELAATPSTRLQYGDMVKVVGPSHAVSTVEKVLGNSMKRLDHPNLIPIFVGIALGCILGSIPIMFPGIPQPVKLGLAGGPLIVSILISHFGPRFKVITYTTVSANLMIREIGIALFLACVGLEAGERFMDTIIHGGGLIWIFYGAMITIIPVLIGGIIGRYVLKIDYSTLTGVLAGSCTNPPALAYAGEQEKDTENAAVGYATVYPLSMFLRVLAAQLLILLFL
ncbi:MAG: transporter [Bacteroidales bacterium]|nr:transporter [Bacteroidales bacterium]